MRTPGWTEPDSKRSDSLGWLNVEEAGQSPDQETTRLPLAGRPGGRRRRELRQWTINSMQPSGRMRSTARSEFGPMVFRDPDAFEEPPKPERRRMFAIAHVSG